MTHVLRNIGTCLMITLIFVGCNKNINNSTFKLDYQNQENILLETETLPISPLLTARPKELISPTTMETEYFFDNFILITTLFPTAETTLDISNDRKSLVEDIFGSKNECMLPCWNDIVPGKSTTQDLINIMELLYGGSFENHEFPDKASIYEENFSIPNKHDNDIFPILQINWENNTVTEIKIVAWDYPGYFNLSDLFSTYGIPDSIKIRLDERNLIRQRYMIVLSYIDEQFIYAIHGNIYQAQNNDNFLDYVCLSDNNEQYHDLYIYDEYPLLFDTENLDEFPWADWAKELGVSTEDLFYELIESNKCVLYPIQSETSTSQIFSTRTPTLNSPTALYSTIIPTDQKREILINIKTPFPGALNVDKTSAAFDKYMDVFNPENGCQLPCWNGITPGISGNNELSTITEILYGDNVSTLGLDKDTMIHAENFANPDKSGDEIYPLLEIRRENDIVTDIEISSWDKPEFFDLNKAYHVLGLPDSIKIRFDERNLINKRYVIVFNYDEEKFVFTVRGNVFVKNDEDYYVCLSDLREQYNDLDIYTDFPKLFDFRELEEFPYFDWENELGITIEELYLLLLDPTKCILY